MPTVRYSPEPETPMHRRFYYLRDLSVTTYDKTVNDRDEVAREKANLIGSKLMGSDEHAPVLDIDYDAQLLPSKTPGHHHLFLDRAIPWDEYKRVLLTLAKAGLIQDGYAGASINNKQSFARYPSGGVTLAQSLAQKLDERDGRIAELEEKIAALEELIVRTLRYRDLLMEKS